MIFYICLIFLFINALVFRKNAKYFIISSFVVLFIIAGLRKYTVGIDLNGHYAKNYIFFGSLGWDKVITILKSNSSFYDGGLIIFMKLLSCICKDVQLFVLVTSAITYGLIGRYIYKYSKNPYLETLFFYTSFSYFMYMNIIAQGLAIAIILYSIDYLEKKSYFKFIFLVLLANFIHSSAIICVVFIPMYLLKSSKRGANRFALITTLFVFLINYILPFILKYIFPQFAYYFKSEGMASIDKMQLAHLFIYFLCFLTGKIFCTQKVSGKKNNSIIDSNFMLYMTILSVACRFLALKIYIFSRMGFYFYTFAFTFLTKSIEDIESIDLKKVVRVFFCIIMTLFFFGLNKSLYYSYGVVPYKFFWQ